MKMDKLNKFDFVVEDYNIGGAQEFEQTNDILKQSHKSFNEKEFKDYMDFKTADESKWKEIDGSLNNENKKIKIKQEKGKKEKKDKNYKNTYIYGIIFIVVSILLEICNFVRLGLGVLPVNFGIEFSIILMIAGIIFLVPTEPFKIIVMSTFFGVQFIMNIANASLYKVMYDIITVDMIFTLGFETADAFELNQLDLPSLICQFIVLIIFILAIVFGNKYAPKFKIKKKKSATACLLILLFSIELVGFSSFTIFQYGYFQSTANAEYVFEDNEYLYSTLNAKFASMKKYGFWSFYINNLNVFLDYQKEIPKKEFNELTDYINDNQNYKYTNSLYKGQNVSGALAGDNLIVVMMESIEWFAIDPYNTPTLYSFIENDSVKFNNFCARNKTNLSEEIVMLGSIVNEYSFTTINNNVGINTPNSLPNLMKKNGTQTANFFHDYTGQMYDRDTLNKKIGFDNVYTMEQCPIDNKSKYFEDFIDDGDFVEAYKDKFMPKDKSFFSFFTTVTTHGPYEKSNDRYTEYYNEFDRNYDNFCLYANQNNLGYHLPEKGSKEYKILKEYKSKSMAVENAMVVMLNYLKSTYDSKGKPLYDNTTIVLYGDHNAYYSDICYDVKNLDKYANDKELYNIPFVLFNKDLPSGEIDAFCNTYDIFSTICDLHGISFNQGLTQGYSAFSEEINKSVFVSTMCGMFDDNYYTVTLDDYVSADNTIETNTRLIDFKQKISTFLKKQDFIETYYRINYEEYKTKF